MASRTQTQRHRLLPSQFITWIHAILPSSHQGRQRSLFTHVNFRPWFVPTMAAQRSNVRRLLAISLLIGSCNAFTSPSLHRNRHSTKPPSTILNAKRHHNDPFLAAAVLGLVLASPLAVPAYEQSDYASETVTQAVKLLKSAQGNADSTFSAYEEVAAIITEGKGVGGNINYRKYYVEFTIVVMMNTSL